MDADNDGIETTAHEEMAAEKSELARQLEEDQQLIEEGEDTDATVIVMLSNGDEFVIDVAGKSDDEAIAHVRESVEKAEESLLSEQTSLNERAAEKYGKRLIDREVVIVYSDEWQRYRTETEVYRAIRLHGPGVVVNGDNHAIPVEEGESGWVVVGDDGEPDLINNESFAAGWTPVSLRDAPNVGQGGRKDTRGADAPAREPEPAPRAPGAYAVALTQARDALRRCQDHRLTAKTRTEVESAISACEKLI